MMSIRKWCVAGCYALVLTFSIVAVAQESSPSAGAEKQEPFTPKDEARLAELNKEFDRTLGNKDAKVEILEFASLSCSHCADFSNKVFPILKEKYIDTGKVKFTLQDFPLNRPAAFGTIVAHCAKPEKYYDYVKVLFKTIDSWAYEKNYMEYLANIAKLGGMSAEQVDKCFKDEVMLNKLVERRLLLAKKYDIKGTPSFLINGTKYNAMEAPQFSAVIDALLEDEKSKSTEAVKPAAVNSKAAEPKKQ